MKHFYENQEVLTYLEDMLTPYVDSWCCPRLAPVSWEELHHKDIEKFLQFVYDYHLTNKDRCNIVSDMTDMIDITDKGDTTYKLWAFEYIQDMITFNDVFDLMTDKLREIYDHE